MFFNVAVYAPVVVTSLSEYCIHFFCTVDQVHRRSIRKATRHRVPLYSLDRSIRRRRRQHLYRRIHFGSSTSLQLIWARAVLRTGLFNHGISAIVYPCTDAISASSRCFRKKFGKC